MSEMLRLFIAVNFNNEIKEGLCKAIGELKENTRSGSFSRRENLHLTLAFIGETHYAEKVKEAMTQAVLSWQEIQESQGRGSSSVKLSTKGMGKFRGRDGDIVWAGLEENTALTELNKTLVKGLKFLSLPVDEKEFKPHLTLGRRVVFNNDFDMKKMDIPPMSMEVHKIELMKSERINGNLVYTSIHQVNLNGQ